MWAACFPLFIFIMPFNEAKITLQLPQQNQILQSCLRDIIIDHFSHYKEVTYIDINSNTIEIIEIINSMVLVRVISRTAEVRLNLPDQSYLLTAGNITDFTSNVGYLVKEAWWNPHSRFLILIESLPKDELRVVFDVLLKFHVINVVLMSASSDPTLYTYNPYENYGCGAHYERIINYGKCSNYHSSLNLYSNKFVTGLQNCSFRIACPHWPPYSFDPNKAKKKTLFGIEQFVIQEISILEHFSVNYSYSDDGEVFTEITEDMLAVGPLILLQTADADISFGGLLLTQARARPFNYIFSHLAFTEDIRYLVKRAVPVSSWQNVYLEFDYVVWITLLMAILLYFCIFVTLVRTHDKGKVLLRMIGCLVLNYGRVQGSSLTKYLFIIWIWFAYLVSIYYQSSLISLTANPSYNYQISSEKDIVRYNLKPCVSDVIRSYFKSNKDISFGRNERAGCYKLAESIHTVSHSNDLFTITLDSLYKYYEYSFYDETGKSLIYGIRRPLSKAIYAIYLYKGFPMLDKLTKDALWLRETGLIDHHVQDLYLQNIEKYRFTASEVRADYDVAWYILSCGSVLSLSAFIVEVTMHRLIALYYRHSVRLY